MLSFAGSENCYYKVKQFRIVKRMKILINSELSFKDLLKYKTTFLNLLFEFHVFEK